MTEYVVLSGGDGHWAIEGQHEASNAGQAIRSCIAKLSDGIPNEADYVAVPSRSWSPVKVKQETQVRLRIE